MKDRRTLIDSETNNVSINLYLSTSSTENTKSSLTVNTNAAAYSATYYLWSDDGLIKDSSVEVNDWSSVASSCQATYNQSTGKITVQITANTNTSSLKENRFSAYYGGSVVTCVIYLSKDRATSTSTTHKYNIGTVSCSVSGSYNSKNGAYYYRYSYSYPWTTYTATVTNYESGRLVTGSWDSGSTETISKTSAQDICYVTSEGAMLAPYSDTCYFNKFDATASPPGTYKYSACTVTFTLRAKSLVGLTAKNIGTFTVTWNGQLPTSSSGGCTISWSPA